MIGRLRGILLEKQAPNLLLEVQHGVAYEVAVPLSSFYNLPEIGKEVTLYTHFVVREDQQTLYGFLDQEERALFRMLLQVTGVGPKSALAVLSSVARDNFIQLIIAGDVDSLVRLPGVGKKTAQRLVLELRDKLADWEETALTFGAKVTRVGKETVVAAGGARGVAAVKDAISALLALGYKPAEARQAIFALHQEQEDLRSDELIRLALKRLG